MLSNARFAPNPETASYRLRRIRQLVRSPPHPRMVARRSNQHRQPRFRAKARLGWGRWGGGGVGEVVGQCGEIVRISGEYVMADPDSENHEVGIHDIAGARPAKGLSNGGNVFSTEGMHCYGSERPCQMHLRCAVAPNLGGHGSGRVQLFRIAARRVHEGSRRRLAAVDGDQHPRVEDHGVK